MCVYVRMFSSGAEFVHQWSNQIQSNPKCNVWKLTGYTSKKLFYALHLIYSIHIRSPFSLSIPWSASDNTFLCYKSRTVIPSWLLSNFTKGFNLLYWQLLFNYSSLNWIVIKWISSSATEQNPSKTQTNQQTSQSLGLLLRTKICLEN